MIKNMFAVIGFIVSLAICINGEVIKLNESSDESFSVKLVTQDKKQVVFKVTINQLKIENVEHLNENYCNVEIPGNYSYTLKEGLPKIPIIQIPLSLPDGYSIRKLNLTYQKQKNITVSEIFPAQKDYLEGDPKPAFEKDLGFYNGKKEYPDKDCFFTDAMFFRKIKFSNIVISPFKYDPNLNELNVTSELIVKVNLMQDGKSRYDLPYKNPNQVSKRKDLLYKKMFVNYTEDFKEINKIRVKDKKEAKNVDN